MLKVTIPATEMWDEINEEFVSTKEQVLVLEHSLVSISKWESKWHKPFLSKDQKSHEEIIDYVKCMTITQNVNPEVYSCITTDILDAVNRYIDDPMTATWFNGKSSGKKSSEQVTNEVIYYWMTVYRIPSEYQKWHLNRLLTLIRICNEKNQTPKKMSKKEVFSRNAALNAARRKRLHSKG